MINRCWKCSIVWAMTLILVLISWPQACTGEEVYIENEWNFVDISMDVTQGIPDNASGVLERIKRKGVLRIATEPYFAPQEFIDPALSGQEQYVGADIELAKRIAKRMGVELVIMPMEFTQVLLAIEDDECDLAISALAYTPARASMCTLSKGYYYTDSEANTGMIIRMEDRDAIQTIDDLAKRTIIAQSGSLQEAMTADNVAAYREFRRTALTQTVYEAVMQGDADAGAVDIQTARSFLENNPDCGLMLVDQIHFALDPQYQGDRIAAKKGEFSLICFVNGVIDEVLEDGLYLQWIESYAERAAALGL